MKYIVIIIIVLILIALGRALIAMLRGGADNSEKMFKSLATRVALSIFLFLLVMFAGYMGWIEPNTNLPIR
jgi:flagellar basal body-associated protein FliL